MGLCITIDCGNPCESCCNGGDSCNPCCMALTGLCCIPCCCPNACGQNNQDQPPQTIIINQPPVIIDNQVPDYAYPPYGQPGYDQPIFNMGLICSSCCCDSDPPAGDGVYVADNNPGYNPGYPQDVVVIQDEPVNYGR
ncbi:unnamed protein product [Pieris brassicae]|uniref:Uncharacterized protein n=1 Tax=Pieris brassicae TaxID=7116 RepID=A0A9P0SZQ9_PIEBR|nr:unnamed protein product [Pieris brassicae]